MSHVSPAEGSTAERIRYYFTTGLFFSVVTGIFYAAYWLSGSPVLFHSPSTTEPQRESQSVASDSTVAGPDKTDKIDVVDWSARIAAIEAEVPNTDNADTNSVKQRLQTVGRLLNSERLTAKAEAEIHQLLTDIRKQAVVLSANQNPPTVNAQGFSESVRATVQSILLKEQDLMREARKQSEDQVRRLKEPSLRAVRLEVRDHQDKAAHLRRQITQMQREQSQSKAKVARAEALRNQMSDIQSLLTPFTAAGHMQPNGTHNGYDTEHTVDPAPVSLLRLQRLGALEHSMDGLKRLYTFGGKRNAAFKDKLPLGAYSPKWEGVLTKQEVLAVVKGAQRLLIDHGQAMVEAKLLSP